MMLYLSVLFNLIQIIACDEGEVAENVLDPNYWDKVSFQDDIITPISARNSLITAKIWENGTIPYLFEDNVDEDLIEIVGVIVQRYFEDTFGCINFIERTTEPDYLLIVGSSNACGSGAGRWGGKQPVHFSKFCRNRQTIIHELYHAVGFIHEQSRTDRDDWVEIQYQNIIEGHEYNFDIDNNTETFGIPYDYESIVHYSNDVFSKNGELTIITLDPAYQYRIGNSLDLSIYDRLKIKEKYQCESDLFIDPRE